jgi:hypothetical protein
MNTISHTTTSASYPTTFREATSGLFPEGGSLAVVVCTEPGEDKVRPHRYWIVKPPISTVNGSSGPSACISSSVK